MAASRPSPIWIAELRVVLVHPDGHRVPRRIAAGQPYTVDGAGPAAGDESHCPVEIHGLHASVHPLIGGSTLQALLLGVQFLGTMLHDFIARGGRVIDPDDDSDVPLAALFGPMLREIEGAE